MIEKTYKLVLQPLTTPKTSLTSDAVSIKGIIFDMDGTLTKPQTWMFGEMRNQLQVPPGIDILDHLHSLPTDEEREIAENKLRSIEEKAMNEQEPTDGLKNIFLKLNEFNVHTSICTRNVPKPVTQFCEKFLNCNPFDNIHKDQNILNLVSGPVVTREFKPPKPSPKPLLHIIESWGVSPSEVIMVGDSNDDMEAGLAAGCAVVLLRHKDNSHVEHHFTNESKLDASVTDLDKLLLLLQDGLLVKPRVL